MVQRRREGQWRTVGTKRWPVQVGANTEKFSGKTSEKRLTSGRYRVLLSATDTPATPRPATHIRFRVDRG